MELLRSLWLHLFQQRNAPSDEQETLSALTTDFPTEPLSGEVLAEVMKDADFQELSTDGANEQFRFDIQSGQFESNPEKLTLRASDLLLEFEPPSFPDDDPELNENDMQGLDENFWENYVFDEGFAKDIPNFAVPEFHSLPFDALKLDEHVDQALQ
ncbi:MAG: hypothetical protein GY801_34145 [bacterium]|nr:hypothetical protein [bacterium]